MRKGQTRWDKWRNSREIYAAQKQDLITCIMFEWRIRINVCFTHSYAQQIFIEQTSHTLFRGCRIHCMKNKVLLPSWSFSSKSYLVYFLSLPLEYKGVRYVKILRREVWAKRTELVSWAWLFKKQKEWMKLLVVRYDIEEGGKG